MYNSKNKNKVLQYKMYVRKENDFDYVPIKINKNKKKIKN